MNDLNDIFAELDAHDPNPSREKIVRAAIGYPGGKSRSLDHLERLIPYGKTFVDACCGMGSVLLARRPSKFEILNDRCAGVTAFFRVMRDEVLLDEFVKLLEITPHSREEFLEFRDNWEGDSDDLQRAFKWYYCINYSFQSQGRNFGRSTELYNQLAWKLEANIPLFYPIHERIIRTKVLIENLDVCTCIKDFDGPEVVTYIDPPYNTPESIVLYKHKVNHRKIIETALDCQGWVGISSYPNPLYDEYSWDRVETWKVFSSAAGQEGDPLDSRREYVTEALYIKEWK